MSDLDPKHVAFAKNLLTKGFSDADVKYELTSAGVDPSEVNRYLTRAQWGLRSDADRRQNRQTQALVAMALGGALLACALFTRAMSGITLIAAAVGLLALIGGAVIWAIYRLFPDAAMWIDNRFGSGQ